jgi:hypothetical protein
VIRAKFIALPEPLAALERKRLAQVIWIGGWSGA